MIRFRNVMKIYEDTGEMPFSDLTFHLERGGFLFVTGESGCGKSTLLRLIMKDISPEKGLIQVNGLDIGRISRRRTAEYRQGIGVVFQDSSLIEKKNVFENVAFAQVVTGKPPSGIRRRVTSILSLMGLSAQFRRLPGELSGGERQKVCLARALVNDPYILLADEPTGNLDPGSSLEMMRLIEGINRRGTTVIVATHDLELAGRFAHERLELGTGKRGESIYEVYNRT